MHRRTVPEAGAKTAGAGVSAGTAESIGAQERLAIGGAGWGRTPDGVQRLLSSYIWDADLVRDDLRDYVVEHLGCAGGVLVVDETGFLKKGNKSVGVQRQYSGTAGRIENCQIGVFLAYASASGRTLLDRELYLPQVWADDGERRREAGVPEEVAFRTKPQLAQGMLERAVESGVPFGWVTGDEVYGSDRNLRLWLEQQDIPHVLAIKSNERLWALTDKGPRQVRADRLASQVEAVGWVRCSAGDGAKGPRVYDWTVVDIRPLREPGRGYWLLVRRSVANPGNWPTTSAMARPEQPWRNWPGWPGPGGP